MGVCEWVDSWVGSSLQRANDRLQCLQSCLYFYNLHCWEISGKKHPYWRMFLCNPDFFFFQLFTWLTNVSLLHSNSDCEVFPKNHAAPFSKVLTFYRKEPFTLEAYYNNPKELPYPTASIGTAMWNKSSFHFLYQNFPELHLEMQYAAFSICARSKFGLLVSDCKWMKLISVSFYIYHYICIFMFLLWYYSDNLWIIVFIKYIGCHFSALQVSSWSKMWFLRHQARAPRSRWKYALMFTACSVCQAHLSWKSWKPLMGRSQWRQTR